MKYAIIDIGSNTIKMDIYEIINTDIIPIYHQALPVGLIQYINDGVMSDTGIETLINTVESFRLTTDTFNCGEINYIATASLRDIQNQTDVLDTVCHRTGIKIEIISGGEEAQYSYEGLKSSISPDISSGIMIDMGGGSTEVLGFRDGNVHDIISLPFGCLKLYLQFSDNISFIDNYIDSVVSDIGWLKNYGDTVYLIGGTARSLEFFGHIINSRNDLVNLLDIIKHDTELIKNTVPDRVTTIVPGLAAYCRILYHMGIKNVVITQTSVRAGYIINKINRR